MMLLRTQTAVRMCAALACAATLVCAQASILPKPKKHVSKMSVEALEEQWRTAQLSSDAVAMDKLLSDDYVGITATGQVLTKAQQLDRMRTRKVMLQTLDITDTKIKLKGGLAIVTSQSHIVGTNNGAPLDGTFRNTRVYERTPTGGWKITSFEATHVPGDGKTPARTE